MDCLRCMGSGLISHSLGPFYWKSKCESNCEAKMRYDEGILLIPPKTKVFLFLPQKIRFEFSPFGI